LTAALRKKKSLKFRAYTVNTFEGIKLLRFERDNLQVVVVVVGGGGGGGAIIHKESWPPFPFFVGFTPH
jgi:hypothetical protein